MPDPADGSVDRAARVRHALRTLVAEHGLHGASMNAVARHAGVATGTAYTYYVSKDALVLAAYLETKTELANAATAGLDPGDPPRQRFHHLWRAIHRHLADHPEHARFLLQIDHSPYRHDLHEAVLAGDDPLMRAASAPDIAAELLELPLDVLWELGLSPAVRLAASEAGLGEGQLDEIADACWRAVSRGEPAASPDPSPRRRRHGSPG